MLAKKQVMLAKEKLTDEGLPFGGNGASQDLILYLGSVRGRLLPLLRVLASGGGELAFLRPYLWFVLEGHQVRFRQGVQLGKEKIYKYLATL